MVVSTAFLFEPFLIPHFVYLNYKQSFLCRWEGKIVRGYARHQFSLSFLVYFSRFICTWLVRTKTNQIRCQEISLPYHESLWHESALQGLQLHGFGIVSYGWDLRNITVSVTRYKSSRDLLWFCVKNYLYIQPSYVSDLSHFLLIILREPFPLYG